MTILSISLLFLPLTVSGNNNSNNALAQSQPNSDFESANRADEDNLEDYIECLQAQAGPFHEPLDCGPAPEPLQPLDCNQLGTCPITPNKPTYDWNEEDRKQCVINRGAFYAVACGFLDKQPINPSAQKYSVLCAAVGVYRIAECETDYPPDLRPEPKPPRPWWSIFW
jgi:hypothetical protein